MTLEKQGELGGIAGLHEPHQGIVSLRLHSVSSINTEPPGKGYKGAVGSRSRGVSLEGLGILALALVLRVREAWYT